MGYRVAVVGATGNVGREIMMVLAERGFLYDSTLMGDDVPYVLDANSNN